MTAVIRHSELFPDQSFLKGRVWKKEPGTYSVTAPAGANFIRVAGVAVGGQGEDPGGFGAYARSKRACVAGEVFICQVGRPGTGGVAGDTWVKRAATGEVILYADRGRGTGGVQGDASRCIGDIKRSGVAGVSSGGDLGDLTGFGFGGAGATATQAPGPGGAGQGNVYPSVTTRYPAGTGELAFEFYDGDPGGV